MSLPSFKSIKLLRIRHLKENSSRESSTLGEETNSSDGTLTPTQYRPGVDIKRATQTRKRAVILSSFFFFLSVIFLILVIIGNINDKPVVRNTHFFRLDLTNVFPQAISGDALFVNSIARSLGLHDFYTVGLWNFCEGYNDEGITFCSSPKRLYWFNPVAIILDELFAGATISLPMEAINLLHLVKEASNAMFICFFIGIVFSLVSIFLVPLALYSRWWSLPVAIFTFLTALMTAAATIIATAMFTIFRNVFTSQAGLQIGAELGTQMMVFMWLATGFNIVAFVVQLGLTCCCASRRDVRTGRKRGSNLAYGEALVERDKKSLGKRRWTSARKTAAEKS